MCSTSQSKTYWHLLLCPFVFVRESNGGYMDMTKEESLNYVPVQELSDDVKYAGIELSAYETTYHQDSKQGQGRDSGNNANPQHEIVETIPTLSLL